jgi:hypothetical protein
VTSRPKPNYMLAKPLFIREASASFGHTHHTSFAAMKKCASLGGVAAATRGDIKEGSWSMSWYFLVKWCATLPSKGVEEDNLCVFIVCVIASLSVTLFMQLMC